jgi:hypothetical protein
LHDWKGRLEPLEDNLFYLEKMAGTNKYFDYFSFHNCIFKILSNYKLLSTYLYGNQIFDYTNLHDIWSILFFILHF